MPKYDIAVLGTGLAGLFSAVKLSQAGKRVVVLDAAPKPGGRAVHMQILGRRYAAVPVPTYGFEPGGLLRRMCEDAGLPEVRLKASKEYQVALPHNRITIYPSPEDTMNELKREFPKEADKARNIYRSLGTRAAKALKSRVSSYLLRTRTASDFLSSWRISSELYAFFDVQSRVFLGQPVSEIRLERLALLLTTAPQTPEGGYSWIAEQLCDRIGKHGGELALEVPWPSLLHRSKRIIGLQTETEMIEVGSVILNAIESEQERRLLFSLPGDAVPAEMREALCCLPDYGAPDDLFTLALTDQRSGHATDKGIIALSAVFSGIASENMPLKLLLNRIAVIIPFFQELARQEGEDDPSERAYPIKTIPEPFRRSLEGKLNPSKSAGFKNLYLLPDRTGPAANLAASQKIMRRVS